MTMATLMRIVTTDQHIETFLPYYQPLLSDWLQMSQMSKAFVEEDTFKVPQNWQWRQVMRTKATFYYQVQ